MIADFILENSPATDCRVITTLVLCRVMESSALPVVIDDCKTSFKLETLAQEFDLESVLAAREH